MRFLRDEKTTVERNLFCTLDDEEVMKVAISRHTHTRACRVTRKAFAGMIRIKRLINFYVFLRAQKRAPDARNCKLADLITLCNSRLKCFNYTARSFIATAIPLSGVRTML